MKFKIVSVLLILGMISLIAMIYTGKFNPLSFIRSAGSGGATEIESLKAKAPKNLSNAVTDEKVQIYKWRDKNGVMQFSNTPPPAGNKAEQLVLDPNSNLVQAVKVPEDAPAADMAQTDAPSPYSLQGMKKMLDDARAVEGLLQQRHEEQQSMIPER